MICKKDVISWFKDLESYKRIDTMCALLNMCLPFELRFLGTCLEELGRRDSQELRGIEIRVNNPQDLSADISACQKGEPTDKKIRRKMALYLALIRACNRSYVSEIFKTLEGWGDRDLQKMNDSDTLQELLLVYTMAANHPVFSFEQHMKCAEIFEKIKENTLPYDQKVQLNNVAHDLRQTSLQSDIMPQSGLHMHPAVQHQQLPASIQVIPHSTTPINYSQTHLAKMIPEVGSIQHQITLESIPHMHPSNITIPADISLAAHANATWTLRPNVQTFQAQSPASLDQRPVQCTSPMLSQHSTPSNSRTTSPSRGSGSSLHHQSQHRNFQKRPVGASSRSVRRSSTELTPSSATQHQNMVSNEINLSQNSKSPEEIVSTNDSTMTQLQALIRNGYTRPGHHSRLTKAGNYLQQQNNQHQQHQHFQTLSSNFSVNSGLTYTLQNMTLVEGHSSIDSNIIGNINRHKSGESDSGSSIGSSGEFSPPDTPTLFPNHISHGSLRLNEHQKHHHPLNYNKQVNINRVNGRPDKILPLSVGGVGASVGSSGLLYAHATSPQQHYVNNEIILAGAPNIIQTTNNNSVASNVGISTNSNMGTNAVLITSPTTINSSGLNNVMTSNSVVLQPQQQQYTATYPYHSQHLQTAPRPPLIQHNPGIVPPPGSFRLPGFQISHNSELIYPYHPSGITFLSSGVPPVPVSLRSSPSSSAPTATTSIPAQLQSSSQIQSNSTTLLAASPYPSLNIGVNKQLSCYNCGSQTHIGRDCQESSMDDITRGAVYKLDYSITLGGSPTRQLSSEVASSNNGSGNINSNGNIISVGSNFVNNQKQNIGSKDIGIEVSTPSVSTSSPSLSNNNLK